MESEPAIFLRDVHKAFDTVRAVDGLSLSIPRGEIFGLVGPDGAGKTTSMRLLAAILPADTGEIRVAGHDVRQDPESVRPFLGYLSQRFSIYGDLTVAENLDFFADMFAVPRREQRERAAQLLEMTRMAPFAGRLAQNLSGGMKQKLALMCTLIHRPRVLLLDEPTTGVDPVSRREFWKLLAGLPAEGVTVLVSTPYLDEAERCHRLGFMARGRVMAVDTPEALKRQAPDGIYALHAEPQRAACLFLRSRPEVRSVEVFGDRLHLALHAGATPEALLPLLAAEGFQVDTPRPIAPTLDDAFVALGRRLEHADA